MDIFYDGNSVGSMNIIVTKSVLSFTQLKVVEHKASCIGYPVRIELPRITWLANHNQKAILRNNGYSEKYTHEFLHNLWFVRVKHYLSTKHLLTYTYIHIWGLMIVILGQLIAILNTEITIQTFSIITIPSWENLQDTEDDKVVRQLKVIGL